MTYGLPSNNGFFGQIAGQPQQLPPDGSLGMGASGMGLANAPPMQAPQGMPQQQLPPMNGLADILSQYVQNKTQQAGSNSTVQGILAQRFQPTNEDINRSISNTAGAFGAPDIYKASTPQQEAQTRMGGELAPYTTALGLQGQQADVTLKQAQANQANAMSQFFSGSASPFGGAQPQQGGSIPMNGQPQFSPRGAMIAKMMGLPEGMQIGSSGNPEQIPGIITPGQKEQDTNFAQAWQTYSNTGGAARTQNAIATVDDVLNQLKQGKIQTGGVQGAFTLEGGEPSWIGKATNSPVLVARTRISNAILPQAKALFGARVTNFDAQSLINSQGLDPMAPTDVNIQKLEALKSSLLSGQKDLMTSGQFFQQHGTLAGYQPQAALPQQPPPSQGQSVTMDQVNAAAQKYGKTPQQVLQDMKAKGIVLQQ